MKEVKYVHGKRFSKNDFLHMGLFDRTKMKREDPGQYDRLQRETMDDALRKTADGRNMGR